MKTGIKALTGLVAVLLASAVSCKEEPSPDNTPKITDVTLELVSESDLLGWSGSVKAAVFNGRTPVAFDCVSADGRTASFKGSIAETSSYYVLYPYDESATNNGDGITSSLPREQQAISGGCDPAALFSVGKTTDNCASLKMAGHVLALTINADDVQKIEIATNDETARISGKAKVMVSSHAVAVITGDTSVELSGEIRSGNTFYAVIYPGKFADLRITATNSLGLSASHVMGGEKDYASGAVTNVDLRFGASDWTLETTDGQSYVLDGAQKVRDFSNVNVLNKENVADLTVKGADVDASVLALLYKRIASITGVLTLDGTGAVNLEGFADKVEIKGDVVLTGNASLSSLAAMSAYAAMPGSLLIENCPKVTEDPQSFAFLKSVGGDFALKGVKSALDGSNFKSLGNVKGSFELSDNSTLVTFESGLKTVGGDFIIQNNTALAGLNGFDALERIGGNVVIFDNRQLKTLTEDGYTGYCLVRELANSGVISSEAEIKLGTSSQAVDFAKLPNCAGIMPGEPQDYTIRSKAQMEGFVNGLKEGQAKETVRNLTISGADITSEQMRSLKNRVAVIKGTFTMEYVCNDDFAYNENNWLETEHIFYQESNPNGANAIICEGSIILRGINAHINPNGFQGFETIHGDLVIEDCPRFPYWDGWDPFKNLAEVEGSLVFKGMERGFEGGLLPAINKVGGDFIFDNCGLWYFRGNGIKYIGGDLVIQGCKRLWGLNGFEHLTHIGGNVVIWDNHGGDADVTKYGTTDESGNVVWYGYCLLRDFQESGVISKSASFKLGSPETGEIRISEINTCAEGDVKSDPDKDTGEGYPDNGDPIDGWK